MDTYLRDAARQPRHCRRSRAAAITDPGRAARAGAASALSPVLSSPALAPAA